MRSQLGDQAEAFFRALAEDPPLSIRLHHQKGRSSFPLTDQVRWCPLGYYLSERPAFQLDPHWHGGAYYVQEASSMILDFVLRQLPLPARPKIWVDLCAAPGGKTGILAAHMGQDDVLLANEVVPARRAILRENLIKGGYPHVFLSGESADTFRMPLADVMLIDAPCAGEGMMRKDPEAIRQWRPALVDSCSYLQQDIVSHAVRGLNPGGYVIYSTCSYSDAENMSNISRFVRELGLASIQIEFPDEFQVMSLEQPNVRGYQLYPHRVRGEGLFIAVLHKPAGRDEKGSRTSRSRTRWESLPPQLMSFVAQDRMLHSVHGGTIHLIRETSIPLAEKVQQHFPRAEWLTTAGEIKGRDMIPSHWLAMSSWLSPGLASLPLEKEIALDYLERQVPVFPPTLPYGWYPVAFEETRLGWMKHTAAGWRNHYPMSWRLRQRPARPG